MEDHTGGNKWRNNPSSTDLSCFDDGASTSSTTSFLIENIGLLLNEEKDKMVQEDQNQATMESSSVSSCFRFNGRNDNYFGLMPSNNTQHQLQQQLQFTNSSLCCNSMSTFQDNKPTNVLEYLRNISSIEKNSSTDTKRTKNEGATSTLSHLKVRKEKMGDRITTLQQLVSPFGKTDTASVLSEAIEYIKFLHEQINVLSTPYFNSGALCQYNQSKNELTKMGSDEDQQRYDLRSRGLCLVPVSATFPITHDTTVDFWTHIIGGTFN